MDTTEYINRVRIHKYIVSDLGIILLSRSKIENTHRNMSASLAMNPFMAIETSKTLQTLHLDNKRRDNFYVFKSNKLMSILCRLRFLLMYHATKQSAYITSSTHLF